MYMTHVSVRVIQVRSRYKESGVESTEKLLIAMI
jgi:hypothetical protein